MDTTFETTLDQTSNTIDTSVDDSKLDDTATETNGEEDNEEIEEAADNEEIEASPPAEEIEPAEKSVKSDKLQSIDDNGSTPRAPTTPATPAPVVAVAAAKPDSKKDDKNISRSGRVIKPTKYLLEEIEDSPAGQTIKRKRPLDSPATVQKRRKSDEGSGENGTQSQIQTYFYCRKLINCFLFSEPEQVHDIRRLLHLENMLLKYDLDIKSSLQLSSADPAKCISVLEDYKTLTVTALMLKKNPSTVETVKRLRRYVGNIKDWNFDETQQADFNEKAAKIRKLAEIIYKNFKVNSLMSQSSHKIFN